MQTFSQAQTGLTDLEGAKAVARRILDTYGRSIKGQISNIDCVPMIVEIYKAFNPGFTPNNQDIQTFFKIMDRNNDGLIDQNDVEQLCIRYLCPQFATQTVQVEKVKRFKYQPEIEQKLDVARRLFKKFDTNMSGFIEDYEVANVLKETYSQIGVFIQPSQEEIKSWITMADTQHKDGKISLDEYEYLVIRSLEKSGFKIEKQQIVF